VVAGGNAAPSDGLLPRLWRLNPSGALDTSFGERGFVDLLADLSQGYDVGRAEAVAEDQAGQLFVAGLVHLSSDPLAPSKMFLWKLDPTGKPDATFGRGGLVLMNSQTQGNAQASDVVVDASNRVVVVGHAHEGPTGEDLYIWRFLPTGALDLSFAGGTGILAHSLRANGVATHDYGAAVAIDRHQNIVVAGRSRLSGNGQVVVWRIDPSGVLDPSFATTGHTLLNPDALAPSEVDVALALDANGTIYVAGQTDPAEGGVDLAVWAIREDGSLESSFRDAGLFTSHLAGIDMGRGIAVDASRVWVTGFAQLPPDDFDALLVNIEK